MTYVNAGHNFPFLFSAGQEPRQMEEGDIVLGIMETFPFKEQQISFKPGDIFVLYSDGITEAICKDGAEFGEAGLASVIAGNMNASAEELTDKIIEAVNRHTTDCIQYDDMTLVIIKRKK
jgi:sigma-B regulation protein RsbU (phosphoserine phosphatase)